MKTKYLLLIPVAVVAVGCASPAPVATNFPLSHQKVARTAHHWDVVAEDVVGQTLQAISAKPQLQSRGVYVAPAKSTAFNAAFRDFMVTRLVNAGANVAVCRTKSTGAGGFAADGRDVEIIYDTQLVVHSDRAPAYQPPALTVLASGVAVVRELAIGGEGVAATLSGVALAEWWAGYAARPTRSEIIVTTTIAEQNRFVARQSDVYYVPDGDARLFMQRVASRALCPEDDRQAGNSTEEAEIDSELARQDMIERGMARVNPGWKKTGGFSYSY
ncbi:hypothetical protein U5817_09860 [Aromatoleum evansii]|uniref:Lipoprotein n=1 Tax=Aromatoleum evansii TaxID=59406 RepID=A0ABZ1AR41_AROEV|nr:hypothetical protein U5817_09510 [Aromatoleum evansii]WRL48331.1 hypothetical protein U5817_09860 [Aromatoleum evansii]